MNFEFRILIYCQIERGWSQEAEESLNKLGKQGFRMQESHQYVEPLSGHPVITFVMEKITQDKEPWET